MSKLSIRHNFALIMVIAYAIGWIAGAVANGVVTQIAIWVAMPTNWGRLDSWCLVCLGTMMAATIIGMTIDYAESTKGAIIANETNPICILGLPLFVVGVIENFIPMHHGVTLIQQVVFHLT